MRCAAIRFLSLTTVIATLAVTSACSTRSARPGVPTRQSHPPTPILGPARLSPSQLSTWVRQRQPQGAWRASVDLDAMTRLYIDEGRAEGVAGDVAFIQAIVETGWFRFPGTVPPSANNFAGIGAMDHAPRVAVFPTAHIGVRAQIQHLRAYADPAATTCTVPPLAFPCVDPRFHLVLPKGRARLWNHMGAGNWASSATYADAILTLYADALRFQRLR